MRRGEIWWGGPTLTGGSRKRRPFLIVSGDGFNRHDGYPKVLVVHLTSTTRAHGPFRWEVEIPRSVAGVPMTSVVKCAEIYTVLKTQLDELIGTLPSSYMGRVDRALAIALDLPVR